MMFRPLVSPVLFLVALVPLAACLDRVEKGPSASETTGVGAGVGPGDGPLGKNHEQAAQADIDQRQIDLYEDSNYHQSMYVLLDPRTETCFSKEVYQGNEISVEFMVLNSDPNNAQPLTVTFSMVNQDKWSHWMQFEQPEAFLEKHVVREETTTYYFCLINKNSAVQKKIFWSVSIQGQKDDRLLPQIFAASVIEYLANETEAMKTTIKTIRRRISYAIRSQLWFKASHTKHINYMEAMSAMIDTWSLVYIGLVISVSAGQAFFLKRLFSVPGCGEKRRMNVRT